MSGPETYTVRLERLFQGPMDLLLHLVREQEVEIHEIEISRVITGYLQYVQAMRDLDIEVAGDFLVMAASLMAIKSRSLLPRESVELDDDLDPRDELIQRLMEYRRFRAASDRLSERYEQRARQHPRGSAGAEAPLGESELDLGEVTSWDLLAAFSKLMRETLAHRPHHVQSDPRPLRYYVEELARKLRAVSKTSLRELVLSIDQQPTREGLIGSFCALLELAKLGLIRLEQEKERTELSVEFVPEHEQDLDAVLQSSVLDDERPPAEHVAGPGEPTPAPARETSAHAGGWSDEDDG